MASRTVNLIIESEEYHEGYTTQGEGEWVAFFPNGGTNIAYGGNTPETISFYFPSSYVYANYKNSVTMRWKIKVKVNGTWYTVYEGSRSMSKSSSDFSLSATSIPSDLASALKSYAIQEVGIFQDGSRQIKGESWTTATCTITYSEQYLTAPGAPSVTQSGSNYVISWNPAYSSGSGSITYYVLVDGDAYMWSAGSSTSLTHAIPSEYYGVSASFSVRADWGGLMSFSSATSFTAQVLNPTITAQPSITSMSPTSGQSTTIKWSAASVSNQGSATIYYQYFVGPSSTYSDNYHIGTTTGLTATITEANILAKCGSSFSGTCYVFVRAFWQKADGTQGGWSTPTGKAFTYTPHRTVKYFNGSSWVECIPYYFNGSSWIECIPHYFNGSSWVECSH